MPMKIDDMIKGSRISKGISKISQKRLDYICMDCEYNFHSYSYSGYIVGITMAIILSIVDLLFDTIVNEF